MNSESPFDSYIKSDEIAKFLYDIGLGVNMSYGIYGSISNFNSSIRYFRNAGYQTNLIYRYEDFKTSINNLMPVYIIGHIAEKKWYINRWQWNSFGGHAWVGDGYKEITQWAKIEHNRGNYLFYTNRKVRTTKYIHMNWGWGRQSGNDGWCTYDYWKPKDYVQEFNYHKKMVSITPNIWN